MVMSTGDIAVGNIDVPDIATAAAITKVSSHDIMELAAVIYDTLAFLDAKMAAMLADISMIVLDDMLRVI
jgi:hypothetical protein